MKLKAGSELENKAYIELNINGNEETFNERDEGSWYLEEFIFGVFAHCFEKSHPKFNYYGANMYTPGMLTHTKGELEARLSELNKISSFLEFNGQLEKTSFGVSYIIDLFDREPDLQSNWTKYLDGLKEVNRELIDLIDRCENEGRCVWVVNS